jgi:hypothetical protein
MACTKGYVAVVRALLAGGADHAAGMVRSCVCATGTNSGF